ncbi:hypothetical protein PENSPDRAFT_684335 [Peniophora sp. CONT]|nr:hypothetical protein PENSPDRAFT_684335 [Peniophora sp. CONT]
MVYDVTPDGGVARFNKWLEAQLAGVDEDIPQNIPPNEALQHSFATLADLQQTLLGAKAAHNSKIPVLQLPAEILSDIFVYARDSWPSMRSPVHLYNKRYRPRHSWMRLSEVCRRFRAVALGHSTLWTVLSEDACPSLAYLLKVALIPARRYPKSLVLHLHDKEESLVSHILRTTSPLHELHLYGTLSSEGHSRELNQYLDNWNFGYDRMRLRVLELDLANDVGERILLDIDPLPTLRSLVLIGSAISWKSSVYDKLERLTLTNIIPPPSTAQLRALLKRMNSLSQLKLQHIQTVPEVGKAFVLPDNLQTFEIITPSSLDFAQNISPSRNLPLRMSYLAPPRENPDEHKLRTIFEHWLGRDMRPAAASIRIAYNTVALDTELRFWRFISSALSHSVPDVTLTRYTDETYSLSELLRGVCLSDLISLELDVDCVTCDDYIKDMKKVMDAMPNLHTLRLTECYLANIFQSPTDTDGLRQLHTVDVKQSPTYRGAKEFVHDEVHALARWLQHRRDIKCPVHTLIVPSRVAHGMNEEGIAGWELLASIVRII